MTSRRFLPQGRLFLIDGRIQEDGLAEAFDYLVADDIPDLSSLYALAGSGSAWTKLTKAADESTSSDTTLSDDDTLKFTMAASTVYHIRIRVDYDPGASGLGTADFKWGLAGPAAPTRVSIYGNEIAAGSGALTPVPFATDSYPASRTLATGGARNGGQILIDMMVSNGANPGTFSFKWAQNTSSVDPTYVLKGSYLEYCSP